MRIISDGVKVLAIIHAKSDWKKDLDFITENGNFIQVGTWWYDAGRILAKHSHKEYPRVSNLTQEIVVVMSGSMLVNIFNSNLQLVESVRLESGDLAIMLDGAHGYEILENNTKVIEAKNGPFLSVEIDKVKYE